MARDYGRRPSKRNSSSISKQLLLVLVCFLFGYLSASIFDFTSLSSWVNSQLLAQHTVPTATKTAPQQAQLPKPKFEFYTLLASEHAVTKGPAPSSAQVVTKSQPGSSPPVAQVAQVASVATVASVKPSSSSSPVVTNKEAYLVQIGSFKSEQEAERMKAALTLKGFVVNVSAVTQQKTNWYRVTIGPFASRAQAISAQLSVARSEHITGMIRKMDA